eukprot:CAMPEP_0171228088 /NCGR_PEP_ID=MMETSP0790-20130122/38182_1 /TAXON_ID=2925 /ORGANISM="Alexandrium catenella, Strain OF101" /LENGTH=176 /DNA_ID=CAMNT_0011694221 /DNA_START=91 /DNA_END=618 /DNA_ORIENTATION=-
MSRAPPVAGRATYFPPALSTSWPWVILPLCCSWWHVGAETDSTDPSVVEYGYECDMAIETCARGCERPVEMESPAPGDCDAWKCVLYCAANAAGDECLKPWTDLCLELATTEGGAGPSCDVDCSAAARLSPRTVTASLLAAAALALVLRPGAGVGIQLEALAAGPRKSEAPPVKDS